MATVDKLLKYLNSPNVAEFLDDEKLKSIAEDVIVGYQIDEDSRAGWLNTNKEAIKIIKTLDNDMNDPDKEFPFFKASKVVYPLLSPAIIQLSSRLIQHIVRNGVVGECVVLGDDQPAINPQTGQPTGKGIKETKADSVTDFLSYEKLIESDSWLLEEHKICTILSAWGMAFKECYYDHATDRVCDEFIPPEDVIINHNTISLNKCRRITIRKYFTKNDIMEHVLSGTFLDIDPDELSHDLMDNESQQNDSREINPGYEVLKQYCYLDLDDDDYAEPYCAYVHQQSKKVLGLYPAFELEDVQTDEKGHVTNIEPRFNIVDCHLIDDPEGKYYSLGLNHLLIHTNKSITSVLRQLLDSGTLANQQGGFVTKAFKTKERALRFKLAEFKVLDTPPGLDLRTQIMPLPFKEPSQVLLALLQVLIESGKETGYMTDVLTGDAQTQNVPATSMLAMVEQGTRAFKPVVQKYQNYLKKQFKIWFHLHSKHLNQPKYFKFQDKQGVIQAEDFDESSMDIVPIADPTMSSEAHKYARLQAMIQFLQTSPGAINPQEAARRFFTDLQFPNVDALIAKPQPAPPDPKLLEVQLKAQMAPQELKLEHIKQQIAAQKVQDAQAKTAIKQQEFFVKANESKIKSTKTIVDAHKESQDVLNQQKLTKIEAYNAETERQRVNILANQSRNTNSFK